MLRVHRLEQPGAAGDAFGRTEEEKATWTKRVVQEREQLLLQLGAEVDEHIATGNDIELRERGIADQAVFGEDAQLAQLLRRLVVPPLADEEAGEALGRDLFGDARVVAPSPCLGQQLGVEVGGEDLHTGPDGVELLAQQDRQRVRLLARGTARDPDANWRFVGLACRNPRQDRFGQDRKRLRIAEELGHADQEILEQDRGLRGIVL